MATMFVGTILALAASNAIKMSPLWGQLYENGRGMGGSKRNNAKSTNHPSQNNPKRLNKTSPPFG